MRICNYIQHCCGQLCYIYIWILVYTIMYNEKINWRTVNIVHYMVDGKKLGTQHTESVHIHSQVAAMNSGREHECLYLI